MTQPATVRNPFMLMLNPEVVLAAMEKSERLSQLNRHLCRPLDRATAPGVKAAPEAVNANDADGDSESDGLEAADI